jgi:hypothetical protein
MLRRRVYVALFASFPSFTLLACSEHYSNDPKVAAGYAAAAGGLAIAQAVASAHSTPPSTRESPSSVTNELHALRDYAVEAINRFRAEHGIPRVTASRPLVEFAQRGSEWLQEDHQPKSHLLSDARCSRCGEIQGRAQGEPAAKVEGQIDTALRAIRSDPDRSAILLAPNWQFVGVGIVNPGGEMYLTIDLSEVYLP